MAPGTRRSLMPLPVSRQPTGGDVDIANIERE